MSLSAALYYNRKRNRERRDHFSVAPITARFDGVITTVDSFPSRSGPITFGISVKRTGGSAAGTLFEIGSGTRGVSVTVSGEDVTFTAGGTGDDQASVTVTGALGATDHEYKFVFAINPNEGRINVFGLDGKLLGKAIAVNGDFGGDWADSSNGDVGVSLVDLTLIGSLKVANGYLPAAFLK